MSELLACCSAHFAELQELLGSAGSSPAEMKGSIRRAKIGESVLEVSPLKLSESPASFCQELESFLPHLLLWRYLLRAYPGEGMARSAKISLSTQSPQAWPVLTGCWTHLLSLYPSSHWAGGWLRADTGPCWEQEAPSAPCARVTSMDHQNRWGDSTAARGRHPRDGCRDLNFHWYNVFWNKSRRNN